jgi:hypothetical protein
MRGGANMDEKQSGLTITFIDKGHRAAYMEYNGCSITLNFSKERNPEIKDSLKEVLIGSVIHHTKQSQNCIDL